LGEVRVDVDGLGVVQAYRRLGVGTRVMGAIERWARARGAVWAMLDTYAASPLSVPFYDRGMATGGARSSLRSGSTRGPMSVPVAAHQPAPDRTLAVWLDSTPELSCTDSTQAHCLDAEHHAIKQEKPKRADLAMSVLECQAGYQAIATTATQGASLTTRVRTEVDESTSFGSSAPETFTSRSPITSPLAGSKMSSWRVPFSRS
jgi:hypothetical protein